MRKTFHLFVTFVALFVTISTFTSCEDNGSGNTNPLVGKWQCKNHYNGGADYYTFTSDGQYTWDGPNDSWGTDFGKYAYNRELGTMTFTSLKGNHPGGLTTITYMVLEINNENFIIMDNDGDSYTYFKVGNNNNNNNNDNKHKGHEYVDMGLSVKWATHNVGADTPEDFGNYYAWGETKTKSEYTAENSLTYEKPMGDISGDPTYDAARANWGGTWRIPTKDEMEELLNNCSQKIITQNGVNGLKVTSNINGNSIFLPAAGGYDEGLFVMNNEIGGYWISSPYGAIDDNDFETASILQIVTVNSPSVDLGWASRHIGFSIRPVCD